MLEKKKLFIPCSYKQQPLYDKYTSHIDLKGQSYLYRYVKKKQGKKIIIKYNFKLCADNF